MNDKITNIKSVLLKKSSFCKMYEIDNNKTENEVLDIIANDLNDNIKMIALKNKNLTDKEFIIISKKIMQLCSIFNSICLIYNRCDIAKLIDANGVILNKNAIELNDAIKILDKDKLFGYCIEENENYNINFDFILSNNMEITILNED